jgi:hypothetical protein
MSPIVPKLSFVCWRVVGSPIARHHRRALVIEPAGVEVVVLVG